MEKVRKYDRYDENDINLFMFVLLSKASFKNGVRKEADNNLS